METRPFRLPCASWRTDGALGAGPWLPWGGPALASSTAPEESSEAAETESDGAEATAEDEEPFRAHRFLPVPVAKIEPGAGFTTGVRGRYVYRRPEDRLNRVTLDLVSRISVRLVQQHELRLRMRDMEGKNEVFGAAIRFDGDPVASTTLPDRVG